jgi:2-polyprenyl-3-methyl-5-hydroxy-6-metoxy-1,4-benzoquinol methylase
MSSGSPRSDLDQREIEFFARYYAEQAYHPTGSRLKLARDLRVLRRAAGARGLGRVLSIGCGDGEFERMLAPCSEHVTAIDLSPEAIAIAKRLAERERVPNLEFRCVSFAAHEWTDAFDTIVCVAFLHHVPAAELPELLRRIHDRLAPGGLFYAQDPNVHGILRKIGRIALGSRYDAYHSPDERELDADELRDQLRTAGFASVAILPIDLTLLPAMYLLAKGPGWPLYSCAALDRLWCSTPLGRWASGFAAIARRAS